LVVIFISGCIQQEVTCNPPYIKVGTTCCLDQNNNKICDIDEQQTLQPQTTSSCGDGICQSNENCSSCPQDCGECKPTQYCGDGICQSNENCSSCPSDCGTCKEEITYSDINSQVTVSGFRYVSINCNGDICREGTGSAISRISGYSDISKSYSFKVIYSPTKNKPLYFQAYAPDVVSGFSTSNHFKLSPGENIVYMSSTTPNLYDDLNVKLCFSYIDFYIANNNGIPTFYKNGVKLDESEYVCINKVFEKPNIDVNINPSSIQFSITTEKNYDKATAVVTNTGNAPVHFYVWAPNINDGTGRTSKQPDCYWYEYFILKPNENKEIKLTCGIYSSPLPSQNYFSETGYIYALPSEDCGTQSMPLNKAGCPETALFKKPFTLNFVIS